VLVTHPDVSLAAVVGIPDEEYGEEVLAFVIAKPGKTIEASAIIAWSKREMAAYKYPRIVEVVGSFPLGPSGKILKTELRKLAAERLQAVAAK
jgi:long-chain acyl-CoA synthetase